MREKKCISKNQYRIILAFSLVMIFTTNTVPLLLTCWLISLLFCLINVPLFKNVKNKRVCWGIFTFSSALMGELLFFLSKILPFTVPTVGFFLLPGATFLFLLAPMFNQLDEEEPITAGNIVHGFLFYLIDGGVIAILREGLGFDTFFNVHLGILKTHTMPFFSHSSSAALMVLLSLIFLRMLRKADTGEPWVIDTDESIASKYRPISLPTEKKYFTLCFCMLVYDLLFGGISVLVILRAPEFLIRKEHIVFYSTIVTLLLFTLIIKGFKQSETLDENKYVPLLTVIKSSLPMIYYMSHLMYSVSEELPQQILWWIMLILAVWLSSTVVMLYTHVIHARFMFGKQPRCMQGIPFILLHILLALTVFIPWMEILARI
ncbi:MAG: hypothetical protein J6Y08_08460 [Clostridiales bacterium]|nr:hypothetical protein [Clostridiales bacterium]